MQTREKNIEYIAKHEKKAKDRLLQIAVKRLEDFRTQHSEVINNYLKTGIVFYENIEIIHSWKTKFEKYKSLNKN